MTLKEIFQPISKELQLVEKQLRLQLQHIHQNENIHHAHKDTIGLFINHLFETPGKKLRPALVLLSAKLNGSGDRQETSSQAVIQLATAVEFIHSASLVHDDVLDNGEYRRNQLSLNETYGNKIAIITGDMLFSLAFSVLLNLENTDWQKKEEILQIFCRTTSRMCIGEMCQHQIITAQRSAEFDEYLALTEDKTARLMSACCQCGAILSGRDQVASQKLADFGLHFGLAFQLADDVKDKDAPLNAKIDIIHTTKAYIEKAKAHLQSANGNKMAQHLAALCDFLLPDK